MIAKTFITSIGFLLSKLSYKTLEAIIQILVRIYFLIPQKRKRLLLSNLTHAFPQWSEHKIKDSAKNSDLFQNNTTDDKEIEPEINKLYGINIYGINYNILRIMGGLGTIAFAN